jgi:hypothetical protein
LATTIDSSPVCHAVMSVATGTCSSAWSAQFRHPDVVDHESSCKTGFPRSAAVDSNALRKIADRARAGRSTRAIFSSARRRA